MTTPFPPPLGHAKPWFKMRNLGDATPARRTSCGRCFFFGIEKTKWENLGNPLFNWVVFLSPKKHPQHTYIKQKNLTGRFVSPTSNGRTYPVNDLAIPKVDVNASDLPLQAEEVGDTKNTKTETVLPYLLPFFWEGAIFIAMFVLKFDEICTWWFPGAWFSETPSLPSRSWES